MRSKTKDFDGTAKEYLDQQHVKLTFRSDKSEEFERIKITARFSVGSLQNISFQSYDIEDIIRMVISTRLTYLGDKAKFEFRGRTRTINF